jgi:hypothetical protein
VWGAVILLLLAFKELIQSEKITKKYFLKSALLGFASATITSIALFFVVQIF